MGQANQATSGRQVVLVLPDIRSTYNTGAFFRTADAAGVQRLYLTGITATPPHPHLLKVSLGAEQTVPWEYSPDALALLRELRDRGFSLIALEQTATSVDFRTVDYASRVAVIVGNEVNGLAPELIAQADVIVHLPMRGSKESLNVSVAGGILLYHMLS
jgi:tRNA G18 (ribose-2'-O)-methylase SpoU